MIRAYPRELWRVSPKTARLAGCPRLLVAAPVLRVFSVMRCRSAVTQSTLPFLITTARHQSPCRTPPCRDYPSTLYSFFVSVTPCIILSFPPPTQLPTVSLSTYDSHLRRPLPWSFASSAPLNGGSSPYPPNNEPLHRYDEILWSCNDTIDPQKDSGCSSAPKTTSSQTKVPRCISGRTRSLRCTQCPFYNVCPQCGNRG